MRKISFSKGSWALIPALVVSLVSIFISSPLAKADSFTTTGANDYYFTLEEPQLFTVRAYAQQYGIDSMLWLYDSNNNILVANDDSQYGLDSYISINLDAGVYRLRTGVCCGNPDAWYGTSYDIDVNIAPSNAPETTTTTTSTTTTTTSTTTSTTTTTTLPTTTTTIEPYYNSVENLTAVVNEDGSVTLNWDPPDESNIEPYIYTITWFDLNEGVESGGWGVWTRAENTSYTVGAYQFPNTSGYGLTRFKVSAGNAPCVGEGNGSCVYGPSASVDETTVAPITTTTTTTAPETTTTTTVLINTTLVPTTTTVVTNPPETLPVPSTTTSSPETTTTTTEPKSIIPTPQSTSSTTSAPPQTTTTTTVQQQIQQSADVVTENTSTAQLVQIINNSSAEEVINIIKSISSPGALENVINTISEESIDASTTIAVIKNGNFKELPIEKIAEVFAAIEPDQFTEEQKTELAAVLTEAPAEVKEAFEEEIDIYGDGFDDYTPTGSSIDVGTRKSILAATAAIAAIAVGSASTGGSTGGSSGGGSGGSGGSGSSGGAEGRSRKEEESGEMAGEIAGPEEDDGEEFTKNSIYKYYIKEGKEMKKFNWFGFSKKMWDITAGLAFTLAGSLVVYITLSGITQRIAGIATLTAILVHYVHEILKNDE